VYALPDVFQANARIYINAESMIKRAVGDLTVPGSMMNEVSILTREMLSRPQLEKVARQAGLDAKASTVEQRERLLATLNDRIKVTKEGRGDNVFEITYQNSSRETAETVIKTLLDVFVQDALGDRRTDSGAASAFVEQQIAEYERRLNDAEERLAAFKRDNIGLMPGDRGDYYTRLQRAIHLLEDTRGELRLANERRAEYEQQLRGEEPVFGIGASPGGKPGGSVDVGDAQIAQYEADLNNLLLKDTENHPDVIALRETIDRLKAQKAEQRSRLPSQSQSGSTTTAGPPLETNPVYERMRIGKSEAEVEIATLKSKIAAQAADVANLQKSVDTIPETERQLTALNRDYDVTRQQYEILLKRRETLHITGEVEESGDQLQFRVMDPPHAPLAPVGPKRGLLLIGTTIAAIGAGLALAFLLQLIFPVFVTRRELREMTGLPVLGTVSLVQTVADRTVARRRKLIFFAIAAALPSVLIVVVVLAGPAHRAVAALITGQS